MGQASLQKGAEPGITPAPPVDRDVDIRLPAGRRRN